MFDRYRILFLAPLLTFSFSSLLQGAATFNEFKDFGVDGVSSYEWGYFITTRARSSYDPPERRSASATVSFAPGNPPTAPEMHAESGSSDAYALSVVGNAGSSSAGHGVHGLAARGTDDYARSYAESTLGWIPTNGSTMTVSPGGHIWAKAVDQEGSSYDQMGDPLIVTWNLSPPAGPKVLNIFEVAGSANTGEARWSGRGIEFTEVINGHLQIDIPSDDFLVSPSEGSLSVQFTADEAPQCTSSGVFGNVVCPSSGTGFLDLSDVIDADGVIDFQFSQPVDRVESTVDSISIRWGDDTSQGFDLTPPSAALPELLGGTQYADLAPPTQVPPTLQREQDSDPYDGYLKLADDASQSNVIFLDRSRDFSDSTISAKFRFRMTDSDNLAQGDAGLGFILMPTADFGDEGVPTTLPEAWLDTGTVTVTDTSLGLGFDIIADNGAPLNRISIRHAEDSSDANLSVVDLSDGQWHEAEILISEDNNEVVVTVHELATLSNGVEQEEFIQASETVVFALGNYPIAPEGFRSALGGRTTGEVDVDEVMIRYGDSVDNDDAIQSLCGRLQEGSPVPDLNGDGVGNLLDLERLVLPGDANRDNDVDKPDFDLLLANFTLPGNWDVGDFNCDGVVQFSDFVVLHENWGRTAAAAAAVPEPTGGVLATLAAYGLIVRSRRKRGRCRG